MANDATDTLMTFIDGSKGVPAECQATWDPSDSMRDFFVPGSFFEIEDFSFGAGLENDSSDEDQKGNTLKGFPPKDLEKALASNDPKAVAALLAGKAKSRGGKFSKYILEGVSRYTVDVQEISISRQFDKASPLLLRACLRQQPYSSAALVKRKVVGGVGSSNAVRHMGFLRMDFDEPLITSIDWEDGENIKEKLKFVCRELRVSYKPQKPDGTLGDTISMFWKPTRRLANST